MEAKDTMFDVKEYGTGKTIPMNAQEAISLSFKAGIKEVVDWVIANALYIHPDNKYWQAKLKEWGINTDS